VSACTGTRVVCATAACTVPRKADQSISNCVSQVSRLAEMGKMGKMGNMGHGMMKCETASTALSG
jgi:hypothetical protein